MDQGCAGEKEKRALKTILRKRNDQGRAGKRKKGMTPLPTNTRKIAPWAT